MVHRILAVATFLLALITAGCGLAIHFKWVGEMEPRPHIVLGALLVLLTLAMAIAALIAR